MGGVVVVNADDLGVSRGATLGVVRAHREGVVTSASLAPTGPDYRHAVETCQRDCPELGIGLHFTLSAGSPVSPPAKVPLLVDRRGYFRWTFVSLLGAVGWKRSADLLQQIEVELEAQLERLRADGIRPDHIDSERHVHLIPGIFETVVRAAERHGIPFVRAGNDTSLHLVRLKHLGPVVVHGGFIKFSLLQGLTRRGRRHVQELGSCDNFASYLFWFLTQMYARFSLRQVGHRSGKTLRMCSCSIRSGAVVCRSVDGRLRGPLSWWGPARRQPDQTQAADSMSLTWRRTVKASRTRPRLSPTFYAGAEPSLTVQPPWNWQPHHDSAVCCGRTFREPATPLQIRTVFFSHVSH